MIRGDSGEYSHLIWEYLGFSCGTAGDVLVYLNDDPFVNVW